MKKVRSTTSRTTRLVFAQLRKFRSRLVDVVNLVNSDDGVENGNDNDDNDVTYNDYEEITLVDQYRFNRQKVAEKLFLESDKLHPSNMIFSCQKFGNFSSKEYL